MTTKLDSHAAEVDPEARTVVAARDAVPAGDLEAMRRKYAICGTRFAPSMQEGLQVHEHVIEENGRRTPTRLYQPAGAATGGLVVWAHGGGWITGSVAGFEGTAASIAAHSNTAVLSIDYALAPEHPFPHALEQVRDVVRWVREGDGVDVLGHDPDRVVVGGDSAGGNLVAVAARTPHLRPLVGQVLVYSVTDRRSTRPSYSEPSPVLSASALEACWDMYLGGPVTGPLPDFSPIDGELGGLPRTLLVQAGLDILRDDGVAYSAALRAAGVQVETHTYPDLPHGFLDWAGVVRQSREAHARIGRFVRAVVAHPGA